MQTPNRIRVEYNKNSAQIYMQYILFRYILPTPNSAPI